MNLSPAVVTNINLGISSSGSIFQTSGGYSGIGSVEYRRIDVDNYGALGIAKPYFSSFSNIPLKNELIFLLELPNPDIQNNISRKSMYYLSPINIWNSVNHNGIPNIFNNNIPEQQKADYEQVFNGITRTVKDGQTDISLGNTFKEKLNIKPLTKNEGDVLIEGRFGNSIRFGSLQSNNTFNGQPITIIRNGQREDEGNIGFLPISENINFDKSSIYLTSEGVSLPINSPISNFNSYLTLPPTQPNKFLGSQIAISSGRLYFQSTNDHIILSSGKSISFNAVGSINLDTNDNIILQSDKIYIGDKEANQSALKGNITVEQLNLLLKAFKEFLDITSKLTTTSPNSINALGSTAKIILDSISDTGQRKGINFDQCKSDSVFITE